MTETNLREILVATARAYMGANTYNGQKQEIIDIYNKNQPRPRGYKVQYTDAWCATFVSAMGAFAMLLTSARAGRTHAAASWNMLWLRLTGLKLSMRSKSKEAQDGNHRSIRNAKQVLPDWYAA